ncbi:MAG: class I SAM-dependent methyltransferase [Gammaproteobacteria bacterium]|nr:class I SAM-dependent methyltransferase [Gammaproteobacteria bacterium]
MQADYSDANVAHWCQQFNIEPSADSPWLITWNDGLQLQHKQQQALWLQLSFTDGRIGHRTQQAKFQSEPVLKAMKLKPNNQAMVIDATAGLGRDGFLMASTGATVIMYEENPILAMFLTEGLARAAADAADVTERITVHCANAIKALPTLTADTIYLDPMYPSRKKSAAVKRDMQVLHTLLPPPGDADDLLESARQASVKRIVVKRPKTAPVIFTDGLVGQQKAGATRFDLYAPLYPIDR